MLNQISRALLLYQQSRFDLAEQELRRVLTENLHDGATHALLALCLVRQEKLDEAEQEAGQAIVLAPDWAYTHHCRSIVLEHRKRYSEAEAAAREAIRLQPLDPEYLARLASTLYCQGRWQETYEAVMEGLSHEAEHPACSHLRTMALTKLGRQDDAVASVDSVLAREPDDAMAHTNKGWALLHQHKPREALEHFREALRIDPTSEYARMGIVEALKARNMIYRVMLVYFLWMARLSNRARWGIILGGYIAYRVLLGARRANEEWDPWILPLLVAYVGFALMTWFAYPFFNLMLRLNKFGRHALSHDQRVSSNWFGACLVLFIGAVAVDLLLGVPLAFLVAGFAAGMALPLVMIYQCDQGWPRQAMTYFASAMAVVGILAIFTAAYDIPIGQLLVSIFLVGFVATPWVANYLTMTTATR